VPRPSREAPEDHCPNPFNPSTTLRYHLAEAGQVELTIYNVMGQQVRVLIDQVQQAGGYEVEWDATDGSGQRVAPGLYLYRLMAGDRAAVGKMLLVK
jgi:flagellar hook assembly protein FlgD